MRCPLARGPFTGLPRRRGLVGRSFEDRLTRSTHTTPLSLTAAARSQRASGSMSLLSAAGRREDRPAFQGRLGLAGRGLGFGRAGGLCYTSGKRFVPGRTGMGGPGAPGRALRTGGRSTRTKRTGRMVGETQPECRLEIDALMADPDVHLGVHLWVESHDAVNGFTLRAETVACLASLSREINLSVIGGEGT